MAYIVNVKAWFEEIPKELDSSRYVEKELNTSLDPKSKENIIDVYDVYYDLDESLEFTFSTHRDIERKVLGTKRFFTQYKHQLLGFDITVFKTIEELCFDLDDL